MAGKKQLWKEADRPAVQAVIRRLLKAKREDAWVVSFENCVDFNALSAWSNNRYLTRSWARLVLQNMELEKRDTVDDFERIFWPIAKNQGRVPTGALPPWTFYVPLIADVAGDLTFLVPVRVLGVAVRFARQESVDRRVGKRWLRDRLYVRAPSRKSHLPSIYLSISSKGYTPSQAWNAVQPAFDALRGMLELTYGLGQWSWSSRVRARRRFPLPSWCVAFSGKSAKEVCDLVTEEPEERDMTKIDRESFKVFRSNLRVLQRAPSQKGSLSVILDALRLYAQALDARFLHNCFIGLWQMAEAVTGAGLQIRHADICARLAEFGDDLGVQRDVLHATLMDMARKRHLIVHRGIHSELDQDDVNVLKTCCETVLLWLIECVKGLPTKSHLEFFYKWRTANRARQRMLRDCVRHLEKKGIWSDEPN